MNKYLFNKKTIEIGSGSGLIKDIFPNYDITTTDIEFYLEENSDIPFDTIYRPKGFFPSNHGELIFNLDNNKTYGPYVDGEYFKVSKLLDKKRNGNARASHVLISYFLISTPSKSICPF